MVTAHSFWFQTWWRHQMETFSALLVICAGNPPVPGEFPTQRPVTRSFDVFFDLRLNKPFSKQSRGWWLETPSRPLWCHRNEFSTSILTKYPNQTALVLGGCIVLDVKNILRYIINLFCCNMFIVSFWKNGSHWLKQILVNINCYCYCYWMWIFFSNTGNRIYFTAYMC